MNKTNETIPAKLNLNYLSDYAHFLLHNKLNEFALDMLSISQNEKVSFLHYFEILSEQEMIELSFQNTKELLENIVQNNAQKYINYSLKKWVDSQFISRQTTQFLARDITNFAFIHRKAFRNFLFYYTSELAISINIMDELDRFISMLEEISFNTLFSQKNIELEKINTELTSFSYVASHDLKEPLRKIKTYSNLIIEKHNETLPANVKDYMQRIITSTANMQKLIDDLLAFSHTASAEKKFETLDLNMLLEEVENSLKDTIEEKKVTITSTKLPTLKVIAFQFRQLLENIIGNAIKYNKSDVKPNITITSKLVSGKPYIKEGADPGKSYHRILFADNGIGFEQQYARKIFELFQRLHGKNEYSGTGVGLAICKKIMENHKGFITAHSKIGEGSIFTIFFPVEVA